MTLRAQIDADLKKAMLERDEVAKDALRMAKADLLLRETELGRGVTDEEVHAALAKGIKARKESIEQYEAAGRADAVAKERAEIDVLARYLPKGLDEGETRAAMQALAAELGLSGKKDLGRLMKELKARHPGVDGKLAAQLAPAILG